MNRNEVSTVIAKQYADKLGALYEAYSPIVERLRNSTQRKTAAYLRQLLLKKAKEYKGDELSKPESGRGGGGFSLPPQTK